MNTSFSAPVLWPQPQWMVSCDTLDFGRVRPGQTVQRPLVVANVGGGAASLPVVLRSKAPWLQLRAGEGADWTSEIALSLQSGEENLILCRVDASKVSEAWGGHDAIIEIFGENSNIANASSPDLNAENHLELPSVRASAYFLEPRFLRLSEREVTDVSGTTAVINKNTRGRCEIEIGSTAVPLGDSPKVALRLHRSDALPTRAMLDLFTVKRGKAQWFDCQLLTRADEQILEITFYTSNREPAKTHSFELEIRDSDELVEPATIVWNMTVARPPLLQFEPVEARAVPKALTKKEILLSNVGEGELHIESITIPNQHRRWLTLEDLPVTPFTIPAGEQRPIFAEVSGRYLAPTQQHRGAIEISCNHAGRRVIRRIPVAAIAPTHATRIEVHENDLQPVLTHGTSYSFPIKVWNEDAKEVTLRFVALDSKKPKESEVWIGCEPARITLPSGGYSEITVSLSAAQLPVPTKTMPVECNGLLAAVQIEEQKESQVWNRKLLLRVQPRPKKFGLF